MKKFLEIIKNKWLIKGTTTLLLVAIVIACYVLINWGVSKIKVENIDCTPKKLYSLSDETKEKIKNLDKDVTIQLINMSGSNYVIEYANKYPTITKKINVEEISDLSSRTDLQTKYIIPDKYNHQTKSMIIGSALIYSVIIFTLDEEVWYDVGVKSIR